MTLVQNFTRTTNSEYEHHPHAEVTLRGLVATYALSIALVALVVAPMFTAGALVGATGVSLAGRFADLD